MNEFHQISFEGESRKIMNELLSAILMIISHQYLKIFYLFDYYEPLQKISHNKFILTFQHHNIILLL